MSFKSLIQVSAYSNTKKDKSEELPSDILNIVNMHINSWNTINRENLKTLILRILDFGSICKMILLRMEPIFLIGSRCNDEIFVDQKTTITQFSGDILLNFFCFLFSVSCFLFSQFLKTS